MISFFFSNNMSCSMVPVLQKEEIQQSWHLTPLFTLSVLCIILPCWLLKVKYRNISNLIHIFIKRKKKCIDRLTRIDLVTCVSVDFFYKNGIQKVILIYFSTLACTDVIQTSLTYSIITTVFIEGTFVQFQNHDFII